MKRVLLATVACLFITMPTFGDMTYQRWDFDNAVPPTWTNILPEIDNNPYGQPSMDIYGSDLTQYSILPHMVGGSSPSSMVMTIPNSPETDGWKWVEVRIGYMDYSGDSAPPEGWDWALRTDPVTTPISSSSLGTSAYTANYFPFEEWTWRFEVVPNPQLEWVTLDMASGGSWYVDYVEVTTECVPVPGAVLLGLLGLSVAGVKLRRFA